MRLKVRRASASAASRLGLRHPGAFGRACGSGTRANYASQPRSAEISRHRAALWLWRYPGCYPFGGCHHLCSTKQVIDFIGGRTRSANFAGRQRLTERCGRLSCFEAKRLFSCFPAPSSALSDFLDWRPHGERQRAARRPKAVSRRDTAQVRRRSLERRRQCRHDRPLSHTPAKPRCCGARSKPFGEE